jgi:hypothetical protein
MNTGLAQTSIKRGGEKPCGIIVAKKLLYELGLA